MINQGKGKGGVDLLWQANTGEPESSVAESSRGSSTCKGPEWNTHGRKLEASGAGAIKVKGERSQAGKLVGRRSSSPGGSFKDFGLLP